MQTHSKKYDDKENYLKKIISFFIKDTERIYSFFIVAILFILIGLTNNFIINNQFSLFIFQEAVKSGNIKIVKKMVENGQNLEVIIDENSDLFPLDFCALYGYTELADYLIENGADVNRVNKNNYTPLVHASWAGNKDIVLMILNYNAAIEKEAIKFAEAGNYAEIVRLIKN